MDPTLWTVTADLSQAPVSPRLSEDLDCDVCVVGAGIAGLTTAYRLVAAGLRVVVLDAEGVASGESHHTSAHLVCAMDDGIHRLEERFGQERARQVVESHAAAIDWIEQIVQSEAIECAFRRVPGYLFLGPEHGAELLERERDAALRAGLPVEWTDHAPLPGGDVGPAILFPNQAEFHPVRFLAGLARAVTERGGRIFGDTRVVNVQDGEPCGVETANGSIVTARSVLLATNSPSNRLLITMKMVPYRTFLVAMRATGDVPRALFWDTSEPYHYVRLAEDGQGQLVLCGGGDYQTATRDEGERVYRELEEWTCARFPVGETAYRWSGQVLEPTDSLAFIGRIEADGQVFVCTGDSGQGLTHGTICALLVGDLIQGRAHPWEEIYSPGRVTLRAARDYATDLAKTARNYMDWLMPGEVSSEAEVLAGHGAVMREGRQLIAVYRDPEGTVHRRSAVCTHAGCIVHWDSTARIWACPCHGSRFHPEGEVINGPATAPLGDAQPAEAAAGQLAEAAPPSTRKRPSRRSGAPKL